ncbi:MAG: sodium:alanine symporter family protein [Firmicutes bacterium]|nr:sodium:alanine symporter family protein [Bacillota bacterium]
MFFLVIEYIGIFLKWIGGIPLAVVILATGLYLTIRSRFFQIIYLPAIIYRVFSRRERKVYDGKGDIPPYQALTTALAATVGTGNIAGVATAIAMGGPGAIFWLWLSGFLGAITKYAEIVLAVHYRQEDRDGQGSISGGPMYVLDHGLNNRFLAYLFALAGSLAAFGIGNMVQVNSMADALETTAGVPPIVSGVVLAVITALVIIGGIRRIGSFTAGLVPIMSVLYVGSILAIMAVFYRQIPAAFSLIFRGAFTGTAALGGFAGAGVMHALRYGVSRGVFTNEAGLGSASIAHAAAVTDHPARQGLWGIIEVIIDTHIVCTFTALALLVTGAWTTSHEGASMTVEAFNRGIPGGGALVTIGLIFFAFSTLVSWSYYGEKCFQYLFKGGQFYYRLLWIIFIVIGSVGGLRSVWAAADTLNLFMAIPNLIGVISLGGLIMKLTRDFWKNNK